MNAFIRYSLAMVLLSFLLPSSYGARERVHVPTLSPVPPELESTYGEKRRNLQNQLDEFKRQSGNVKNQAEQDALAAKVRDWATRAKAFNAELAAAKRAAPEPNKRVEPGPNIVRSSSDEAIAAPRGGGSQEASQRVRRIIDGIVSLAKKLGWTEQEVARLKESLDKLRFDGDPNATVAQINGAWHDVLHRADSEQLAKDAAQGNGPGFPGAGHQSHEDCAVFALANAAGLPYGVAAARATELIRQGEWRDASERANPQAVIEQHGLNGGEVVMLAEGFGRAQVIPETAFSKTLSQGQPILLNVTPPGGRGGHEVVLTKAFQHDGATWYEMMDSNQAPDRRLYLSGNQLYTLMQETGVAFSPDTGRTPKLLR